MKKTQAVQRQGLDILESMDRLNLFWSRQNSSSLGQGDREGNENVSPKVFSDSK